MHCYLHNCSVSYAGVDSSRQRAQFLGFSQENESVQVYAISVLIYLR